MTMILEPTGINTEITNPPRKGTCQARLAIMLERKTGATISQIMQKMNWQPHSARAAISNLRRRGYQIERIDRKDKPSIYMIRSMAV